MSQTKLGVLFLHGRVDIDALAEDFFARAREPVDGRMEVGLTFLVGFVNGYVDRQFAAGLSGLQNNQ